MSTASKTITLFLLRYPRIFGVLLLIGAAWLGIAERNDWGVVAVVGVVGITGLALVIGGEKFAAEMRKHGERS